MKLRRVKRGDSKLTQPTLYPQYRTQMADQSIQAAVQDLHQQSAGGDTSSQQLTADGKAPDVGVALGWINRDIHEKDVMKRAMDAGMLYINLSKTPINPDLLKLISRDDAIRAGVMPFFRLGQHLRVGVVDPANPETKMILDRWTSEGFEVEMNLCSAEAIAEAVKIYDVQQSVIKQDIVTNVEESRTSAFEKEIQILSDLKKRVETVTSEEALNLLEVGAIKTGASDIHYEPEEKVARIRFRIDGELYKIFDIDKKIFANVINQLKYKCKMKMNVTTIPQDGRYSFKINDRKVDVRVSSIPTQYGESFVCRLLDSGKSFLSFAELGFQGTYLEKMEKLPELSHGMILVTGPTGSGKTTTLYSLLSRFNTPESKVITLEDPIEYHIEGISQSQIDESHGYNFADGLRTILRQDPDTVMIGEIRDLETANVAAQAALTGHVMLSTLHTNSAIESIPRLVNMGLPEFIVAPALHTIVAQRLVRKLCVCATKRAMTPDETMKFTKDLEDIRIVLPTAPVAAVPADILEAKGCELCSKTGYHGRLVIAEIVTIDSDMQELILSKASAAKLYELARKKGMISMQEDGILKVLQGQTTMDEVFQATNLGM